MKASNGILTLILIAAAACGGSSSPPTAPSNPAPAPAPPTSQLQLAVFSDPASSFTTSDVRDAQEQIVRFDTASGSLIWVVDGRSFQGFPVTGNHIRADQFFQVVITPTNVHVPGS